MPRFFVPDLSADTVLLAGEEGRHAAKSLRCREGERLVLCDGRGQDALGVVTEVSGETVALRIDSRAPAGGNCPAG